MDTWASGESHDDAAADQPQGSATGQGQPTPGWAAYAPPPSAGPTQQPWSAWGQPQPPKRGTDGFAIASLVLSLLGFIGICAILGLTFGLVALNRIGRTQRGGRGMAIAGTVIGGVWLVITVIVVIAVAVAGAHS